ncbi:MAG: hypothetical protein WB586_23385 [Chthoniobacterales bacterium]
MTTLLLFLIVFVALGTIKYWAKYIVGDVIIGWHLLLGLVVIGFLALILISAAQNCGKPYQPKYTGGIGPKTAAQELEIERAYHQGR